jgi:RHS repeat-associated protein
VTETCDSTGPNNRTKYAYDVLDDLKTVTQSSETRAFTYNSLNQLVTATNPESGKICYGTMSGSTCTESYDGNGNLLKRTDARSIMTTYVYDVLNRVSSKSYSDGTTPNVAFTYDDTNVTCSKGRLTKGAAAATGSIPAVTTQTTSFDCLGRPTGTSETVGSNAYTYGYTYNLAGGQITETFPSGRVVTTTYDLLNRASGVTGLLSGTSSTYLKSVSYASSGAIAQLQYGATPLMKATTTFDQGLTTLREQPTGIAVTNTGGTGLLTLGYGFCPGQPAPAQCASNNGNVQSASIVAPGQSVNVWQNFNPTGSPYDKVNRLTKATETPQSGSNTSAWSQTYGYDAYGNRWVSANSGVPLSPFTPIASSNFPSNNQLQIGTTSYDLSGNQTAIGGYTNTFDGENRLTSSTLNSIKTTYTYDGSGQRVQKATAGGSTTTYVYDAAGDLTSELVSGTPPTNPCTTCYIASDTLGSTRLMMDASNGNLVALHDYLPFGEEIAGSPVRPGTLYGGTDNPRQKFTGKERDTESGLDYFGERYFSSAQGRFTSPDSMLAKKDWLVDPQRWNKYAYIRNNPLRYVDPNGEDLVVYYSLGNDVSDSDREWFNKNKAAILAAIQAKYEKAGVENVSLRDQSTLTKDQVAALDKNTPFGVARLTFVGKDYPGLGPAPMMGALGYENPDSKRVAAVFLDTFPKQPEAGCDWACIAANVGAHEVGHSLGMEHENTWESITEFFRVNVGGGSPDLMQGGQGVPRQPLDFYTGRDKTKRAIDELNKIGDMTPKKQ